MWFRAGPLHTVMGRTSGWEGQGLFAVTSLWPPRQASEPTVMWATSFPWPRR